MNAPVDPKGGQGGEGKRPASSRAGLWTALLATAAAARQVPTGPPPDTGLGQGSLLS